MDPLGSPQDRPEDMSDPGMPREDTGKRAFERAKDSASQSYESARAKARQSFESVREQASETFHQAQQRLREGARSTVTEQKERTVAGLRRLSGAVQDTATRLEGEGDRTLAEYARAFAGKVDQAAEYVDRREPMDLLKEAEHVVRKQAGLFIGGMFVVGLVVARMMRAAPRTSTTEMPRESAVEPLEEPMLPKPTPGEPSAKESTYIPPGTASRFSNPPEPGEL